METVTYTRDTNYSFLKTSKNQEGESFTRKIEKGNVDYSNTCKHFNTRGVSIEIGNSVTI